MPRDSDPVVRTVCPDISTGKKWDLAEFVEEAGVQGETQGDRWSCPA